MRFLREKVTIFVIVILLISLGFYGKRAQAYYGGYGGIGSITTSAGTTFLGGLYGGLGGLYGGLGGLYGGLGGLYGGLYGSSGLGGLYGSGLYGLSGLGSLYGLSGLGGLYGGLYGLSGLGGLYGGITGLYGGLYGLSGLSGNYGGLYNRIYSLSGLGSLYGFGDLYNTLSGVSGLGGNNSLLRLPQVVIPGTTTLTTTGGGGGALPDPTGSWSGTWLSYINLKGGIANFNLVYDPLTLTVSGTAALLLNKLIPLPISVSGVNTITGVTLTGTYLDPVKLVTYYAQFTCTLVSPLFMTGDYSIHDALFLETDLGEFNVDLVI